MDEQVVWYRLEIAIERVKCMGRERCGDCMTLGVSRCRDEYVSKILTEPLVVRLVQPFVANGVVFPAVNPVDQIVRKEQKPKDVILAREVVSRYG